MIWIFGNVILLKCVKYLKMRNNIDRKALSLHSKKEKLMEYKEFARNRKNCYISADGFLVWKISYDGNKEPFLLDSGDSGMLHMQSCLREK